MGVSEQSQLEHNAIEVGLLEILQAVLTSPSPSGTSISRGFTCTGLKFTLRREYIDYLKRNPQHNILLSCTGVDNIAVHDAERHLSVD